MAISHPLEFKLYKMSKVTKQSCISGCLEAIFLVKQVNYELEQDNSTKTQFIISLGTFVLISGNKLLQANKESTPCLVNAVSVSAESIFKN